MVADYALVAPDTGEVLGHICHGCESTATIVERNARRFDTAVAARHRATC